MRFSRQRYLSLLLAAACTSHSRQDSGTTEPVPFAARYVGGVLTSAEVEREARRLPPGMKDQYLSPAGQRELARSMIDKRLLVDEARRRGLMDQPEIKQQVRELEERLAVQVLLLEEQRAALPPTEAEQRAWYEAHRDELREGPRVHVGRVTVRAQPNQKEEARKRADRIAARLRKGEALAAIAKEGEGPERFKGGDLGWVVKDEGPESRAALAMTRSGTVAVAETAEGYSVLVALERTEARTPPFEELKSTVAGRMEPARQRRVFESLLEKLRAGAEVEVAASH